MYKSITLTKFEKRDYCQLGEYQIEPIKKEVEHIVNKLNEGMKKGKDFFGIYMQSYDNRLDGIRSICSMIGIRLVIDYEEEQQKRAKK
ncbi:hypothetical protein [Paucisalibacillus globulus]|uniref:hypothetical protein n=1 Tax=Paucisalibacillus globulus TaxID=351095 RepID=UPI000407687C|nr:hypothetical protein [Paucisalibacillus globulus]